MSKIWLRIRKLWATFCNRRLREAFLSEGCVASLESVGYLRSISPDLLLDIGANRGQFSLAAKLVHPRVRIIAFEPLPEPASRFERLFSADKTVSLHQVAVTQAVGKVKMLVGRADDTSSILRSSSYMRKRSPGAVQVASQAVRAEPLVSCVALADLGNANLLKVDVQGSELQVLKSADDLLPSIDWIYVEASLIPLYEGQALLDEVIAFLATHGFRLTGIFNVMLDASSGKVLQADFAFTNGLRRSLERS